jgi:hypothetical protein
MTYKKNIIPILRGISDIEYKRRKPEWRKAIGAITSIVIPEQGVAEIFPTLLKTLESLNFKKTSSERRPSKNLPPIEGRRLFRFKLLLRTQKYKK